VRLVTSSPDAVRPPVPLPLRVWVAGRARTKGSLKVVGRRANGSAVLGEQVAGSKAWRSAVVETAVRALGGRFGPGGPVLPYEPLSGPVLAVLWVRLPRPARRSDVEAHPFPVEITDGDLDKLQRNVGDALVDAGVLKDDKLIVEWRARKDFAPSPLDAGALIELHPAGDPAS
jgi:hypothetical protein